MRLFQPSHRFSPWLALFVAFVAVAVATVAFVPHDDTAGGEDLDCLLCKAGQARSTEVSVDRLVEPPLAETFSSPEYRAPLVHERVHDTGSPRAPPA